MHSGRPKITEDIYKTTLESDKNYNLGGILSGKTNKSQLDGFIKQPFINSDGSRREQRSQERAAERSKSKGKGNERDRSREG